MNIRIDVVSEPVSDLLKQAGKQIPFAIAIGLTDLANKSRTTVKEGLPDRFTLRNNFTAKGIQTRRAEKRDYPHIFSMIGTVDKYMDTHDEGGVRKRGKVSFSFPYEIRRFYESLVKRNKWPGKILGTDKSQMVNRGRPRGTRNGERAKAQPFILPLKGGRFIAVVVRTRGKVKSKYNYKNQMRQKYKRLWRLYGKPITLKKREWLEKPVTKTVVANYNQSMLNGIYRAFNDPIHK